MATGTTPGGRRAAKLAARAAVILLILLPSCASEYRPAGGLSECVKACRSHREPFFTFGDPEAQSDAYDDAAECVARCKKKYRVDDRGR